MPEADIRRIYLHWTAGDYVTVFPAYHFCIALDDAGEPIVVATADLRANGRDVRAAGDDAYAAHVAGRNSHACGIAIAAMSGATPHDFGRFPLRDDMVDALCRVAGIVCARYALPLAAGFVATHAEAALEDGYFGAGPDERWDIARLTPEARPLVPADALRTGDALRARIGRIGWGLRVPGREAQKRRKPPFPEAVMSEHTHTHAHEDGTAHAHEHEHHDHEHAHEHDEHDHAHAHDEHEHDHAHAHEAGHDHDHDHAHDHGHDHDHAHDHGHDHAH